MINFSNLLIKTIVQLCEILVNGCISYFQVFTQLQNSISYIFRDQVTAVYKLCFKNARNS